MRIAMVTEHRDRQVDGLSAALSRLDHHVTVHTAPAELGAVGLSMDQMLRHVHDFADTLAGEWRQQPPDVVHSHFRVAGLAAVLAARDLAVPVVHTFHDFGSGERPRLDRLVVQQVTRIIAASSAEALELIRFGAQRSSISVVPRGVDLRSFGPGGRAVPRNERHRLVSVGKLVAQNGHEVAVAALTRLPNTELLIVGGGDATSPVTDDTVERVRKLAEHYGVGNRVALLGHVPHDDMPALLRSADVVICARTQPTLGTAALEAMASGVAVVATPTGGLLDMVVDNVTGRHVPPGNPMALAKAVQPLLNAPAVRGAYGAAGYDRARTRYSWDRIALDTVGTYRRAGVLPVKAGGMAEAAPAGSVS